MNFFLLLCFPNACERAYTIFTRIIFFKSIKQKHTTKCLFKRMKSKIRADSNDGCLNPHLKMQYLLRIPKRKGKLDLRGRVTDSLHTDPI